MSYRCVAESKSPQVNERFQISSCLFFVGVTFMVAIVRFLLLLLSLSSLLGCWSHSQESQNTLNKKNRLAIENKRYLRSVPNAMCSKGIDDCVSVHVMQSL